MTQYTVLQSMVFLLVIVLLAYLALRYGLRSIYRGFDGGQVKVLERVPLDPKSGSSLALVQLGEEVLLLGSSQGGVTLLARYGAGELTTPGEDVAPEGQSLKDSFARFLNRARGGGDDPAGRPPGEKP